MKTVAKINNWLCKVEGAVMVVWFAAVLVVMTCQVISRYVLNAPLNWSEEFARYSFVWISYIGCAYCVGVDGHTNITALLHKLPVNAQKIVRLVGNVIMAACSCASCRSRSTTSPRMARSSHPSRACRLSICTGRSPWALG